MIKLLTYALLLLISFITICFVWREDLSWNRTINYDKFSAYFTSIGALGAAYSLYLLFQQNALGQSAQQLALSAVAAEPIALPFSSYVKVIDNQIQGRGNEQFYFVENGDINKPSLVKELEILNRGGGPAKSLETNWSYSSNTKPYREYFDHHKLDYYDGESVSHSHFIQIKSGETVKIDLAPFFLLMSTYELAEFIRSGKWISNLKPLFLHITWEDTMSNTIYKVLETNIQVRLPKDDIILLNLYFKEFSNNTFPPRTGMVA